MQHFEFFRESYLAKKLSAGKSECLHGLLAIADSESASPAMNEDAQTLFAEAEIVWQGEFVNILRNSSPWRRISPGENINGVRLEAALDTRMDDGTKQ